MAIHIADPKKFQHKLDIITGSLDQTHIVTDFDSTLTQYFDRSGRSKPSIISLLYDAGLFDEAYTREVKEMHDYYYPIEYDTSLPLDFRKEKMVERRTRHKELLIKKWLTLDNLKYVISLDRIVQRSWADALLHRALAFAMPVVVFSASGIGIDPIRLLLQHRELDQSNVHIVWNILYRDQNGRMINYSKPVIHSLNKSESTIRWDSKYTDLQKILSPKPHAIVLGDHLHDAQMVDDRDDRVVLRIGLCNINVDKHLPEFLQTFDVVITDDGSLTEIVDMVFTNN